LTAALFRESNPVPLKHALSLFGLMSPRVRLPLVEMSDQNQAELGRVLLSMCDEYSEYMIGTVRDQGHASRRALAG
jgi:dihydrodipicolinate synthase/N-acetylneuraminate lyase